MKKIGIVLAALVIATFMVGTVAAMPAINKPEQEQYFTEKSCAQGVGTIEIEKRIVDRSIAIDVYEYINGSTGPDGSFAMESKEILNESANTTDPTDPNYLHKKTIQFEGGLGHKLDGVEIYKSPSFYGGTDATVLEHFDVWALQKDETTTIKTTTKHITTPGTPYLKQSLNFNTMNDFVGEWGTDSSWKKICKKDISHHQLFFGNFQVTKNLIYEEDVTKPCCKGGC